MQEKDSLQNLIDRALKLCVKGDYTFRYKDKQYALILDRDRDTVIMDATAAYEGIKEISIRSVNGPLKYGNVVCSQNYLGEQMSEDPKKLPKWLDIAERSKI